MSLPGQYESMGGNKIDFFCRVLFRLCFHKYLATTMRNRISQCWGSWSHRGSNLLPLKLNAVVLSLDLEWYGLLDVKTAPLNVRIG